MYFYINIMQHSACDEQMIFSSPTSVIYLQF